ncbi:MAG: ribbon-helix-helix protein, CopG family [Nanopusillaceae archaeon]
MKIVSIKLYEKQYESLRQFVKASGKSQSDIIRDALNEYFIKHHLGEIYKNIPFETKRIKIYV